MKQSFFFFFEHKKKKDFQEPVIMFGFGGTFESEAVPGALPKNQNNPQRNSFGLYTEQLSGTSFTRPRAFNRSVWLYRMLPSVLHVGNSGYQPFENLCSKDAKTLKIDPNPGRWGPLTTPARQVDFIDGLRLFGQAGNPALCEGLSIYQYSITASMAERSISFCDGELLIVPQKGELKLITELGELLVGSEEICVIPRGIKFSVQLINQAAGESHRGYAVEVFNEGGFRLPELGPIGANGLANPLHFEFPKAKFETKTYDNGWQHVKRLGGTWFSQSGIPHSPFDVVAWRGNFIPYKYDLRKFCVLNTVSFDHPDPSIFTVLTVPSSTPGVAACDFVIFPPRWMVALHTFRPPYFHVNVMSEFMGLITGQYDGKVANIQGKNGFVEGGASLHNRMIPHGPDAIITKKASEEDLKPVYRNSGIAFMFESCYLLETTDFARNGDHREVNYAKCWEGLPKASL